MNLSIDVAGDEGKEEFDEVEDFDEGDEPSDCLTATSLERRRRVVTVVDIAAMEFVVSVEAAGTGMNARTCSPLDKNSNTKIPTAMTRPSPPR